MDRIAYELVVIYQRRSALVDATKHLVTWLHHTDKFTGAWRIRLAFGLIHYG